jgi:CspA family cold shock protein
MNFKDRWATNEKGEDFIFTVEMQRLLSQAGLPLEPASLNLLYSRSSQADRVRQEVRIREVEVETEPESENSVEIVAPATIQIDPQTGKYIGRMKWYNAKKGYGFIMRGGGEEIFFHKSGAASDPEQMNEGQWVLYDVEETRKGPEATEVEPYEGDVDLLA